MQTLTEADIDRQNLSAAKLQGIMTDLHMTVDQFSTTISILYGLSPLFPSGLHKLTARIVGYIPFQIPSNMIMTKLSRPGLCELPPSLLLVRH